MTGPLPATWKFGFPIFLAESRAQWRSWLEANHSTTLGVWLCSWKSATGRPSCPYPDVVEEALCFGWIDSTVNRFDDDRGLQLLTPRRPKSTWTRLNRQRVADLEAVGLMTGAGRRVVEVAKENGWVLSTAKDETRARRITTIVDRAAKGKRAQG